MEYLAVATRYHGLCGKCLGMKDGDGDAVTWICLSWPNPEEAAALSL